MQLRHVHTCTPAVDPPGELPAGQTLASHPATDATAVTVAAAPGSNHGPCGTASASGAADFEATGSEVQSPFGSPRAAHEMSMAPPDSAAGRAGDGRDGDGADADRAPPVAAVPRPHAEGLSDLKRYSLCCAL